MTQPPIEAPTETTTESAAAAAFTAGQVAKLTYADPTTGEDVDRLVVVLADEGTADPDDPSSERYFTVSALPPGLSVKSSQLTAV